MTNRLTPITADILREIMNIGGAHATTALSKISHEQVDIDIPRVALLKLEEVMDFVGGSNAIVSMTLHPLSGDVRGLILFSYSQQDARSLAEHVHQRSGVDGLDISATLREIGNILSGSCLMAMQKFLGLGFTQAIPDGTTDLSGAILESILAEIGERADDALITALSFQEKKLNIGGRIFLLFDPDSTQIVLSAAKKKITHS